MASVAATETSSRPGGERGRWLLPIYPTVMIGIFFTVPFLLIVAVRRVEQRQRP